MTVLRRFADRGRLIEYGTAVLRDVWREGDPIAPEDLLVEEHHLGHGIGSIATAGRGWLHAAVRGEETNLRLELHDVRPPALRATWVDVVETPFLSTTGRIAVTDMTALPPDVVDLELTGPGQYRVRVGTRRLTSLRGAMVIQLWPDDSDGDPPKWLERSDDDRRAGTSYLEWAELIGPAMGVMEQVQSAAPDGRLTQEAWLADLEAAGMLDWMTESWRVTTRYEPLPTGFATEDARARTATKRERKAGAQAERRIDAIADASGIARPVSRMDLLEILVAVGLLGREADGLLRVVADYPDPRGRVQMTAAEESAVGGRIDAARYGWFDGDLEPIAVWGDGSAFSVPALADRLLLSDDLVRSGLAHCVRSGHLVVHGDLAADEPLRLEFVPKSPIEEPDWFETGEEISDLSHDVDLFSPGSWVQERLPLDHSSTYTVLTFESAGGPRSGPPPTAGLICENQLITWTSPDFPVRVELPFEPDAGFETAYGTIVSTYSTITNVGPDGAVDPMDSDGEAAVIGLDETGRFLLVRKRRPRSRSKAMLEVVDLVDRSRRTWEGPEGRALAARGIGRGRIWFVDGSWPIQEVFAWTGGSTPLFDDPAQVEYDPVSGTLAVYTAGGVDIRRPGREGQTIRVDHSASIVPGGRHLYRPLSHPAAVSLFEVDRPDQEPRVVAIPSAEHLMRDRLVWESPTVLVHPAQDGLVRVDVMTGEQERIAPPPDAWGHLIPVKPWIRAGSAN